MANNAPISRPPAALIWEAEPISRRGPDDGLLTAGLALADIRAPLPPDGAALRAQAIQKDFRELVDVSATGGFGAEYGPPETQLHVPGVEITALLRLPGREHAFTAKLLVPDAIDWDAPFLIAAPSSGSRGVTGAIGDIGAWALPQGHALVLTDKSTGVGAHLLGPSTVYQPDFTATTRRECPTTFRLEDTDSLAAYSKANPYSVAMKHAHSRENVEADWPQCVLEAIRYALHTLKRMQPERKVGAVKVIAAGVSNGGGAVLRAAEVDQGGLIDAVVAAEPNITPPHACRAGDGVGGRGTFKAGRTLYDYATLMNLYLPAAVLCGDLEEMPFAQVSALNDEHFSNWSQGLGRLGLLDGATTQQRARDALSKIEAIGFAVSSFPLLHAVSMMQAWPTISYAYANAYGRFGVEEAFLGAQLCFADVDLLTLQAGPPRAPSAQEVEALGVRNAGLTPGGGLCTLYSNGSLGQSLDDAVSLRQLFTRSSPAALRVQEGIAQIAATAQNSGIPTLIVHGDSDPLIAPALSSRAYFDAARATGQDMRNWRYYEVASAQHFETLLMDDSIAKHYQPQLPFFFAALDAGKAYITDKTPLPISKKIHNTAVFSAARQTNILD